MTDNNITISIKDRLLILSAEFTCIDPDADMFARVLKGMFLAFGYDAGENIMTNDDLVELYENQVGEIKKDYDIKDEEGATSITPIPEWV